MIGIPRKALNTPSVRRSSRKKSYVFLFYCGKFFLLVEKSFFCFPKSAPIKNIWLHFFTLGPSWKDRISFFEPSVEKKPWLARAWIRTRNLSILIQQHMPEGFEWFGRILLGLVKRAPCLQALLGHELVGWELVDHGLEGLGLVGHEKSSKRIRASLLLHNYQLL